MTFSPLKDKLLFFEILKTAINAQNILKIKKNKNWINNLILQIFVPDPRA